MNDVDKRSDIDGDLFLKSASLYVMMWATTVTFEAHCKAKTWSLLVCDMIRYCFVMNADKQVC